MRRRQPARSRRTGRATSAPACTPRAASARCGARDASLGRDVALKMLQKRYEDDPELRRRFLIEAQVTGQLEHPGIVPVYELVRPADDEPPYYAMRLVQGRTLTEAVRDYHRRRQGQAGSVELRDLLQAFVTVCNTLAYAHSHGVIRRDLKGANIILGPFGEVLVLDWGLAKVLASRQQQPEDATPRVIIDEPGEATLPGVLGTLAYMAPEQARGEVDALDQRTDVFGLGGVLFEVLTGRPPRRATTREELLRQAREEAPVSPRSLAPWLPRPLEAVCRKALALQPQDRYQTARELADEIKRFLADEPVKAWREPWHVRAGRWVRRHRTKSAALAVAVLVALLAAGLGWGYVQRQRQQRGQQARQLYEQAVELRQQAREASPREALSLLSQARAATEEARGLLAEGRGNEDLKEQVEAMVQEMRDEARNREMLGRLEEARFRLVYAKRWRRPSSATAPVLPDRAGSPAEYARAFAHYGIDVKELSTEAAARRIRARAIRVELAAALDDWAWLLEESKDTSGAHQVRNLARLTDDDPVRTRVRDALDRGDRAALVRLAAPAKLSSFPAPTLTLLGSALKRHHALARAEAVLREARWRKPDDVVINVLLAEVIGARQPPRLDESTRFLTVAASLRNDSPLAHNNLAFALWQKGELDESIRHYREAVKLKDDFFVAHQNLGNILLLRKQYDEAIEQHRKAVALQPDFAAAHCNLAAGLKGNDQLDEALEHCRKAIKLDPRLAEAHGNLGSVLWKQGRFPEALIEFKRCLALLSRDDSRRNMIVSAIRDTGNRGKLYRKLSAILQGKLGVRDSDRPALAELCQLPSKRLYVSSARLWEEAFTANPALAEDLNEGHRYKAACAAALAGCGQGEDAARLDDRERARWRNQALKWLRADLELWSRDLGLDQPQKRADARRVLAKWRKDSALAGLRDRDRLGKLPEGEREAWRKFWAEVARLASASADQ
jgi:tetratricopeptide (TPR) repeat protein/tRNA A-37 threonylcarbamoyl transferase component Bud32